MHEVIYINQEAIQRKQHILALLQPTHENTDGENKCWLLLPANDFFPIHCFSEERPHERSQKIPGGEYSVVFLQETHTDPAAKDSWRLEWGDRVYFSHPTVCTAAVVTLFSPDLWPEVLGVTKAMPGCLLHLWVHMEGLVVNRVNVYAPTSGPERLSFYQQASAFLCTLDPRECLVLGRDLNTTLKGWDHWGTEQCLAAADVLREIVEHHSLVDFWHDHHPDDVSTFTFVWEEAHRSCHSRLDRIYLSSFHLSWAHSSSIQPALFSDHHHLTTMTAFLCAEWLGPAYWHFNNSLLEDVGFVASFREFWLAWRGQQHAFPSVRRWWDFGKVRARLFCRDYTWGASRRRDGAIKQLEWEVLELERCLATSPEDPSLCGVCREKQEELQALEDHWARGTFVRSCIHLLREMDGVSHFFYALEKKRGAKKHITCLLAEDGTPLMDPVEITDYKVIVKAISLQLGSVLVDMFHPDQTYTILGCTIFNNLYLVRDLLELGCRDGLSFALLSLDQEMAFDRVDHGRLIGLVLREPELQLVLSAYADDVLLVVQDPGDLARVEACQAIYSAASSTWVNWVKGSGLVVGDRWQLVEIFIEKQDKREKKEQRIKKVKVLNIYLNKVKRTDEKQISEGVV
ncbi:unnamed protein product [Caretta caretta]